jgi:hypothetical protein
MRVLALIPMLALAVPLTAGAITRDEVIDTARDYTYHEWYCSADNLVVDCSNDWESDYSVGWVTGLPYDWGGYYTLPEYDQAMADGLGAGSHSWHGVLNCTAGVDCSGFVSKAWDTYHNSTSTMYGVSFPIPSSGLTRADALNKAGSHIVLFAHETAAGRPVVYESAGATVEINTQTNWYNLGGYEPIRYDNIEDGTPRGTLTNPIEISSFPYDVFDATPGAGSHELDGYSCDPSTAESGPERVYRLQLDDPGTLTATITDDAGVDVDLHLLSGPSASDCVVRDDVTISHGVQPGEWWLVVDSYWSGSAEYPGGYFLHVEYSAGPGDDDDDVGDDDSGPGDDDVGDDDVGDDDDSPPKLPALGEPLDRHGCACAVDAPRPMAGLGVMILLAFTAATRWRR